MSDYKETHVTGKKWQRCNVVHIDNPYQAQPMVTFAEQEIAEVDGATFQTQLGQIVFPFDPAATINLRDPGTGELTGQTMTGADIYAALYSLYIQSALERDAALITPSE